MNNSNSTTNRQRVADAMDAMKRAMAASREQFTGGLQLTRTQLEILLLLSSGSFTTGEMAGQLVLTQSAVTQTVDTLVRRNLVERHPGDTDRRVIHLTLTPDGATLTTRIGQLREEYLNSLMRILTPDEVETLITITRKLTSLIEETNVTPIIGKG
jgi:DNA-binding MarR family transcriptional regulator